MRQHGEHGAIVRALTADHGMVAGYLRGGRSRRLRAILIAGNQVIIEVRARTKDQLGGMTAELLQSRAPLLAEPIAAAALEWLTSLTAASLPEGQPYPALYSGLAATLDVMGFAASARQWAAALARYELLLLAELGFGLNLSNCVVSGADKHLIYLSPKSGSAVSAAAAEGFETKLFRLPAFLRGAERHPNLPDIMDGLTITGHFLNRDILGGHMRNLTDARMRLIARLNRAVA